MQNRENKRRDFHTPPHPKHTGDSWRQSRRTTGFLFSSNSFSLSTFILLRIFFFEKMTAGSDQNSIISAQSDKEMSLDDKKTPWRSIWICIFMQFIIGIEMSIYYMSTWPYLNTLDSSADFHFVGWIVASGSIGCSLANPIFGWYNQKTMSVKVPAVFGLLVSCFGQFLYALLPLFASNQKWIMVGSRLIIGFGTGAISVLRGYTAMASVPKDRLSAISYSTAGWVLGLSLGPAIQSAFTPIGEGWLVGGYKLDLYTLPPYFMVTVNISSSLIMWFFFKETYAGILDEEEQNANNVSIPKFDLPAALVCIWLYICTSSISTNIEIMSTPLSTAMYNWSDSKSIAYNGILTSLTSFISVCINFIIGSTRIGKIDKRKQIFFGLVVFMAYHLCNYPWPFYPGPLTYIPVNMTSAQVGGCEPSYVWCADTVAVPLPIYIISFVVFFGVAFPFVGSPSATLYADILGPRPQGTMQGMYSFSGSVAQFVAPILATFLYQISGYRFVILTQIGTLTVAFLLMCIFYRRMIPIKLESTADKDKNPS